jgi:hypothetical protein
MWTETAALIERLWQAEDLDEEAAHASRSLTAQEIEALRAITQALNDRVSARRILSDDKLDGDSAAGSLRGETTEGLLILLVLATYHSDTLLFLPAELRHKQVRQWAERTGFPLEIVKEATVLGREGLPRLLNAA